MSFIRLFLTGGTFYRSSVQRAATSYGQVAVVSRASTTGPQVELGGNSGGVGRTGLFDEITLNKLALNELFATAELNVTDAYASAELVLTTGTECGLVLNLDSVSSPANFVIAYHDGSYVYIDKCVAGVYTNMLGVVAAYVAGAALILQCTGTTYSVTYNGSLKGSCTISDAAIRAATRHGIFSTYADNTIDNVILYNSDLDPVSKSAAFADCTNHSEHNDITVFVKLIHAAGEMGLIVSAQGYSDYVYVVFNGTSIVVHKVISGVDTVLSTTAVTYVVDAYLSVAVVDQTYTVHYNNSYVTAHTITDSSLYSQFSFSWPGLYTTNSVNSFDDFVVFAKGTEGQYIMLDAF